MMARTTITIDVAGDGWVTIEGHEITVEARTIPAALRQLADVLDRRATIPPKRQPGKP